MVQKIVQVIPVMNEREAKIVKKEKKLRVAAYCRVSTELEEQQSSYKLQVEYYTSYIQSNLEWIFVGIYADEGITGTNTKKRDGFNKLIKDCLLGKIDMVITKSVSRFARNTLDCLATIRKLKEKNIAVFFEKENINTLDGSGEMLLTILSSLAQEESRSLSTNTKWGITKRFEKGEVQVNHNKFMGFTKNEEGELIIVPEEAEIVKKIFRLYLEGNSTYGIAKILETECVKTVTGNTKWAGSVILKMLKNEKYMGDALLQKTYTVDFLTKKRMINNGNVRQYYVKDNHEAIIPKDIFYRVQEELARRANLHRKVNNKRECVKYSSKYALTGLIYCNECGAEYRRVTWSAKGDKEIVWRCLERLSNGKKNCMTSATIKEYALKNAIIEALKKITTNCVSASDTVLFNTKKVLSEEQMENKYKEIDEKINTVRAKIMELIDENIKMGSECTEFDRNYMELSNKLKKLQNEKNNMGKSNNLEWVEERMQKIKKFMENEQQEILEYDDMLVRKLVKKVLIISKYKIIIQFTSGESIEQEVEY